MRAWLKKAWPILKILLLLVVLGCVGWQFVRILNNEALRAADASLTPAEILWDSIRQAQPFILIASGLLYLAALVFSLMYWMRLVRQMGDRLPLPAALRGYYISHLAKYVPGKGLALLMRVTFAAEAGVRPSVAALTAIYETLALMAAGAIVATVLFTAYVGEGPAQLWHILLLLAIALVPLWPGVFNTLVRRLARRFLKNETQPLPPLGYGSLIAGLALLSLSWFVMGASLEATLCALDPERSFFAHWLESTAFLAVAYVAGFVASTPGGLGVREFLLQTFLAPQLGAQAVVAVLLLRLLWTAAEVVMAAVVYWLPGRPVSLTPPVPAS